MKHRPALLAFAAFLTIAAAPYAFAQEADAEDPAAEEELIDFSLDLSDQDRPQDSIVISDRPGPAIEVNFSTELIGGNYDSGETNAALDGIDSRSCHMMCVLDDRCKAYTHDGPSDMCTLKNSVGEKREHKKSLSTIMIDRDVVQKSNVVYRGWANTTFDAENLNWRPEDTAETYVKRTRDAAASLGGTCDQEREELKAVQITPDVAISGRVGENLDLSWSGNGLSKLNPVWLVVSTPAPIRVGGKGVYALAPGARGPFGLDTAIDETRAMVALYNHAAGINGRFSVVPLEAGILPLKATVVTYMRACQEVVELYSADARISIDPAAPRIVVSDPYARNQYQKQADIASLERRVFYNENRFLIVETVLDSEIIERNGTDIQFSPTGRFAVVRSGGASEVIDVIDGTVVTRIGDTMSAQSELLWFHNDSFVAVTRAPWGRAWLASTLKIDRPAYHYEPSSACCDFPPDAGLIDVNLENNIVRVWGPLAGAAVNLMDFEIGADIVGTDGFEQTFANSQTLFFDGMGPVSALPAGMGFNRPFPPDPGAVVVSDAVTEIAAAPPGSTELATMRGAVSLISPQEYVERRSSRIDLGPFEFVTAPENKAQTALSPDQIPGMGVEESMDSFIFEAVVEQARKSIETALDSIGVETEWIIHQDAPAYDCGPYLDVETTESQLPPYIDFVQRVERPEGFLIIARSRCEGGGTSGSQSFRSSLMIFDEVWQKGHPARDGIVDENATDGTQFDYKFYDQNFETKLIGDDTILFHVPNGGAIVLFDLKTRQFTWQRQNLTRGDLLNDAHVSSDGRTVLQVNSDLSFALHDVASSEETVQGKQVDGETVFWSRDFRFDSTAEGASFVELRFPGVAGQYTFQQFDARLRRSGLLAAALGGQLESSPVVLHVPPRLTGTLTAESGELSGEAIPEGTELKEIRLYQDGVLTDTFAIAEGGAPVAIRAKRLPGARWATLVAADAEGLVSLPIGRDLGNAGALANTQLLAIGIDTYSDGDLPSLSLARADAVALDSALASLDGKTIVLDQTVSKVLADDQATRVAILDAARTIVDASGPGDNTVISFSGHGLQGKDGRFYLALSSTRMDDIEGTALAWDDLAAVLSGAKGRVTVLLDACHSGSAGTGLLASNDDAVDSIRATIPSGLTVLAASKGRELSAELPTLGGGVFTHVLTKALTADRSSADRNANGRIEVSELYRYVKDNVSSLRKGEQTPWLSRNQMIGDFSLF